MRVFVALLPLLGFVTAQMHGQQMMGGGGGQMGGGNGQMGGGGGRQYDPFFNDFGKGTSSRTAPPWAAPPRQAAPGAVGAGNGGNFNAGGSSTMQHGNHPAMPFGDPQVANNNPYANADPNAGGGNSGGLAGFGETDYFHAQVERNGNAAQPMPAGAGGAVVGGAGRGSGLPGADALPRPYGSGVQDRQGGGFNDYGEAGIDVDVDPRGGNAPSDPFNTDYFGGVNSIPDGAEPGQHSPNGGTRVHGNLDPAVSSPDMPSVNDKPVYGGDPHKGGGPGGKYPLIVNSPDFPDHGGKNGTSRHNNTSHYHRGFGPKEAAGGKPHTVQGNEETITKQGLSSGASAGIAIGVLTVAGVVAGAGFFVLRRRRQYGYQSSI